MKNNETKKIMVVNCGSSSLKFRLIEMPSEKVIIKGLFESISEKNTPDNFTSKYKIGDYSCNAPIRSHTEAVQILLDYLMKNKIISSYSEIDGVGHRVVQGGKYFSKAEVVDEYVKGKIKELIQLAPLHNKAHLDGIEAFESIGTKLTNVVVFDTAFHQTMEPDTYMYALPYEWYEKYGIRKYGAHGTSHKYVANKCAEVMGRPVEELKIITCHIGNGASISAVKGGKCIDTSMGLTPLEGIPMGTRSGNIDPTVLEFMNSVDPEKYTVQELLRILNKESGYLGVSQLSHDSRTIEENLDKNPLCNLALDIQYKRIADYIGSYYVHMGGADAIVFTAGIGENSSRLRREVLKRVQVLGVELDDEVNDKVRGEIAEITKPSSKIKAFLIPTEEELMIARDVYEIITK